MNQQRPVFLDLTKIKFPLTAIVSILHRISGVLLFLCIPVYLYFFHCSLASPEEFASIASCLNSTWAKLLLWFILSGLFYHLVAGIRHIIMDFGIGESLRGGKVSSLITIFVAIILILLTGYWIWL